MMRMPKRYPEGPWEVEFYPEGPGTTLGDSHVIKMGEAIGKSDGYPIQLEVIYNHGLEPGMKGFEEAEAIAEAMSSAPELIDAMEWLVNVCCGVGKSGEKPSNSERKAALRACEKALASARVD